MKYSFASYLFVAFSFTLMFYSCSKPVELQIGDADLIYLSNFVGEANDIAQFYEDLEGPKGSEIFGYFKDPACEQEEGYVGPCTWAIDDIVKAIGYGDIKNVNSWIQNAGKVLYKIEQSNPDFEDKKELISEVVRVIDPGISTRNSKPACYEVNVVLLLKGALDSYSINTSALSKEQMYSNNSPFYKIWRYMTNLQNCL